MLPYLDGGGGGRCWFKFHFWMGGGGEMLVQIPFLDGGGGKRWFKFHFWMGGGDAGSNSIFGWGGGGGGGGAGPNPMARGSLPQEGQVVSYGGKFSRSKVFAVWL